MIEYLPHINASLNTLATILLIAGFVLIKQRQEKLHKAAMLSAFATSCVFLACYLTYHFNVPSKKFPTDPEVAPAIARYVYYAILLTHVLLAMSVPFLAIAAIYAGWKDRRESHRRIVRWAWPIWLYVSITGIIVYLMLYQIFVPRS